MANTSESPPNSLGKMIRVIVETLLDGLSELTVRHQALVEFLEQKGTLDRSAFNEFLTSYQRTHQEQLFEELKKMFRSEFHDQTSGPGPS